MKKTWISLLLLFSLTLPGCDVFLACLIDSHLQIDTNSIPEGQLGVEYIAEIEASVRNGFDSVDYEFEIINGELPLGLVLQQEGRFLFIEGFPEEVGRFTFRLEVFSRDLFAQSLEQSSANCVTYEDTQDFDLVIRPVE